MLANSYDHCCFWGWALYTLAKQRGVADADIARTLKLRVGLLRGYINACLPIEPKVLQAACILFRLPVDAVYELAQELQVSGELPQLLTPKQVRAAAAVGEEERERARLWRSKGKPSRAMELLEQAMANSHRLLAGALR